MKKRVVLAKDSKATLSTVGDSKTKVVYYQFINQRVIVVLSRLELELIFLSKIHFTN